MPYEDPDPTDPMTLHGVAFGTDDARATHEMAGCFIEEYFRLGFSAERIMKMFRTAGYAGPNRAWRILGEDAISDLIEEHALRWGPRRARQKLDRNPRGDVVLPVL